METHRFDKIVNKDRVKGLLKSRVSNSPAYIHFQQEEMRDFPGKPP